MSQSFWQSFKDGQAYAAIWPKHSVVAAMTESRVVPAVRLAARWMPALAVLNFVLQWQLQGLAMQPQGIVTSLFMLSLPFQGWYWLGKRANSKLDARLQHWYLDLAQKLQVQPRPEPRYMDLAKLIRKALQELPPDQH